MEAPSLETLKEHIEHFNLPDEISEERIAEAYKIAKRRTEDYKKGSKEFKLLDKFQKDCLKALRAIRKAVKSAEELNEELVKKQAEQKALEDY